MAALLQPRLLFRLFRLHVGTEPRKGKIGKGKLDRQGPCFWKRPWRCRARLHFRAKTICARYNTRKGCEDKSCRLLHVCCVQDPATQKVCGGKRPAVEHKRYRPLTPAGAFGRFLLGMRSIRPFRTTHRKSRRCFWRRVTDTCDRVLPKEASPTHRLPHSISLCFDQFHPHLGQTHCSHVHKVFFWTFAQGLLSHLLQQ